MIYKVFNIKIISLIATSLFFLCQPSFSQSTDWMTKNEINVLKSMNLTYDKPNRFDEVIGNESFENNSLLKTLLWTGSNQLRSKDHSFVAFNKINNITIYDVTDKGLIRFQTSNHLSPKEKKNYLAGATYILYVKSDIKTLLGEEAADNWEAHVNFYSKEETVNKFNADRAISYSIKLQPKDYYKGKYNNLWVLFLQKKYKRFKTPKEFKEYKKLKEKEIESLWGLKEKTLEEASALKETTGYKDYMESWEKALSGSGELFRHPTGFVMIYCFYKDMPKRKLAKYKTKIEGMFKYKD